MQNVSAVGLHGSNRQPLPLGSLFITETEGIGLQQLLFSQAVMDEVLAIARGALTQFLEALLNRWAVILGIGDSRHRHKCSRLRMHHWVLIGNNDGRYCTTLKFMSLGNNGKRSKAGMNFAGLADQVHQEIIWKIDNHQQNPGSGAGHEFDSGSPCGAGPQAVVPIVSHATIEIHQMKQGSSGIDNGWLEPR